MGNINVSAKPRLSGLVVVIGAPASGKSTLSKRLADALGCRHVSVSELVRREGFILGMDERRGSLVVDEEKVREWILGRLREVGCLVVETISPHSVPREEVELVVVVRCRPSILVERLRARGYHREKVRENVEYEAIDGPLQDALEIADPRRILQVNGCGDDPNEEVTLVLRRLEGEPAGHEDGEFNWTEDFMSLLEYL